MQPVIETKEAFQVLAMTREIQVENSGEKIPEFWTWFRENGYMEIICGMYGMCHSFSPEKNSFLYSIASPYDGSSPVPSGFEVLTVPAHTWAIFRCVGAMPHAIQDMWGKIENEWFPTSGYERFGGFDIEQYTRGDLASKDYESFIWVAVRGK